MFIDMFQVFADADADQRGDGQGDGARPVHTEDGEGAQAAQARVRSPK